MKDFLSACPSYREFTLTGRKSLLRLGKNLKIDKDKIVLRIAFHQSVCIPLNASHMRVTSFTAKIIPFSIVTSLVPVKSFPDDTEKVLILRLKVFP